MHRVSNEMNGSGEGWESDFSSKCARFGQPIMEVILEAETDEPEWYEDDMERGKSNRSLPPHALQKKQEVNKDRNATEASFHRLAKHIKEANPNPPSILKVPVFGTSMKNIPHEMQKETLIINLKQDFPLFMDHRDLDYNVYNNLEQRNKVNAKEQSLAVVSGARGEIRDLQRQSFSKAMYFQGSPYNYVFLPDFGVERSNTGNRMNPVSGTAFHVLREREGPQQRQGIRLFTNKFRQLIPEKIMNPLGPSTFCFQHSTFTNDSLPVEGIYRVHGRGRALRKVFSGSELEAIQLIRKLNGSKVNGETLILENERRTIKSGCRDQKGLGVGGAMIKFDEFTHAVPLSWIDDEIRNDAFIQSFSLKCFRCETNYTLVSTSSNLEYLMAKCACTGECLSYAEWNSRAVPIDSPYHFPDEVHTRLSYNLQYDAPSQLSAIPYLPKVSNSYPSVQMMCNILLPILEEEWRAVRDESVQNLCSATVKEFEFLGKLEKGRERRYYHILVQKDKFWSLHRCTAFKDVTIEFHVKLQWKEAIFHTNVKGYLSDAKSYDEEQLLLYYEVSWDSTYEMKGSDVVLTPHADKNEYAFCRKYLNKLPQNFANASSSSSSSSPHLFTLSKLLHPNNNSNKRTWLRANQVDMTTAPQSISNVFEKLNKEQAKAFTESMSIKDGTSIIQGPPGTGKSYLVAAIALGLVETRSGVVLCTAGSNVACDVIYDKIENIAKDFNIKVNVCRVYSRGREIFLDRNQTDNENSTADSKSKFPKRALHNLVTNHEDYLKGRKQWLDIRNMIINGEAYKMTKQQRHLLQRHISWIEKRILEKENIIIMTVGCFAAYRLGKLHHTQEEDELVPFLPGISINSVLVDEAGILSQTAILPLETVGASKIILIGDHLQLTPQVLSRSAEEAGLVRSLMEVLIVDRKENCVPMTMLRQQFRAHPDLRELTSHVTYSDRLYDANHIKNRVETLGKKFFQSFPRFKKNRVWVIHHNGREKKVSNSRANVSEANIVSQKVKDFLWSGGMSQHDIVVLTPYEAQRKLIEDRLKKDGFGQVACKNVDEFQGNESTCVIVSFTRSNSEERLGFLMIANRLNVCISRAREVMLICMNLAMLKPFRHSNSHLGKMYRYFLEKQLVTTVEVAPSEQIPNMQLD